MTDFPGAFNSATLSAGHRGRCAAAETSQSREAHQRAKDLAGSEENLDQIYNLSGKIFQDLAKKANGDPKKMQELLDQALADTQGFASQFTPEQKQQLKNISIDIEKVKGASGGAM